MLYVAAQITKVSIKEYELEKSRIPHCGIELRFASDKSPLTHRLWHKVAIKGVSPLGDNFYLRYPQSDGEL